jgi:hypothetical protein
MCTPDRPDPLAGPFLWRETQLSSKIARLLGTVALAAAPVIGLATPAHAAAGCSVDNASTSTELHVTVTAPPPVVSYNWTSESCSYVSNGGTYNVSCTLVAGRCQVFNNGTEVWRCTTANSTCTNTLVAAPGDVIRLVVDGGRGTVQDTV